MYLNLGVGPAPIHEQHLKIMEAIAPIKQWTLVDLYVKETGIKNWDATKLDEVRDMSVKAIVASHLLEHIPHPQLVNVFTLWFRKIEPGGELIINVPDLIWTAKQLLKLESGQLLTGAYTEFEGERGLQSIIYGTHSHKGERHQSGFTKRSLGEWLEGTGFKDVSIEEYFDAHDMQVLLATCKKPK